MHTTVLSDSGRFFWRLFSTWRFTVIHGCNCRVPVFKCYILLAQPSSARTFIQDEQREQLPFTSVWSAFWVDSTHAKLQWNTLRLEDCGFLTEAPGARLYKRMICYNLPVDWLVLILFQKWQNTYQLSLCLRSTPGGTLVVVQYCKLINMHSPRSFPFKIRFYEVA